MELWIRSQDKEKLLEIKGICLKDEPVKSRAETYPRKIIGYGRYGLECELGTYHSKTKALQILDEIKNQIEYLYNLKYDIGITVCDKIIYQMPEK